MIQVNDLHKNFGKIVAVAGATFTARDGEITGLLGPNGAGKTTTLRCLYTLMRPDRGQVLIDGIDAAVDPVAVRRRLGVLPDARGLYKRLSARENIAYFGQLHGLDAQTIRQRTDAAIAALEMADIADRRTEGFSQGQRVKTAIARALIHDPKNVILDEPTNGLDVMATRAMREFLKHLKH
jgi:sodium transport system ATP-binding protein